MAKIIQLENKVSVDIANDTDNEEYERYIPVEQSIIIALKQVREIQAGRLPKKGWRELFAELDEDEEMDIKNEKNRIHA